MPLPQEISALAERFSRNLDTYKSPDYNEARLRVEFLDPLFESLGWDIANSAGYADAYKDVIHEDSLKIAGLGGGTKAPDYCFRIGGTRKFFLEAKKPAIDIKGDPSPAYQLRRYAWSAKLPISVLSDFEEFAIYDSRIKPNLNDKASTARIFYCTYEQFPEKWDEIAAILSKDSVLKGSFDKFAQSTRSKRGTAEVDDAFLAEIEKWRDELAANLALRNPDISERDLNVAVTKTIDRIVFLRICEDRGVEIYAQLQTIAKTNDIYGELLKLFRRADEKYNSGLFHFSNEKDRPEDPDILTPTLTIDDKTLRPILASLYYPECPYEFSVLPSDILGHVYEQFLGKIIRLTPGHRAKIEEKPEVRKAGGVYYTPTYVVDYIVQNTVGKLLGAPDGDSGLSPRDAAKLKILDPACGAGSFLLGAYQYLLDWHLRYYTSHNPEELLKQKNPPIYQVAAKSPHIAPALAGVPPSENRNIAYRLTTAEKKRILLNNIRGVDIDQNAVETTKLALLLKVLEGESGESLNNQMKLFRQRALPDLAANIKCGNSLIARDFYENGQFSLLEDEKTFYKINAFDWKTDFSAILKSGGFDAVIGNPPYIRMESLAETKNYLRKRYLVHEERADLYAYFVERAVSLAKTAAAVGMIVSNKFIRAKYGRPLRRLLDEKTRVMKITDFAGANVFKGATVRTLVLLLRASTTNTPAPTIYTKPPDPETLAAFEAGTFTVSDYEHSQGIPLSPNALAPEEWRLVSSGHSNLLDTLRKDSVSLSDFLGKHALFGLKTGFNEAFIIDDITRRKITKSDKTTRGALKPILLGKDIRRYVVRPSGCYVIYLHPDMLVSDFPAIEAHLRPFKNILAKRAGPQKWFELQQPAVNLLEFQRKPKIIYPIIANQCRFVLDSDGFLINDKAFILPTEDLALLGVLNSKIGNAYFSAVCAALEGSRDRYLEFRAQYVDKFPVPLSLKSNWPKHDRLVNLVESMLLLHQQLAKAKSGREQIQRQIAAADHQIDTLVYNLYQLTPAEIQLVELTVPS